jgi:AbrB family looped-hinge helix DNA binding protein
MTAKMTLDKAGRVLLPKELRDELRLGSGDILELESEGEKITLRPIQNVNSLLKKEGVWVFHTGTPLTATMTNEMMQNIRQERDHSLTQELK